MTRVLCVLRAPLSGDPDVEISVGGGNLEHVVMLYALAEVSLPTC